MLKLDNEHLNINMFISLHKLGIQKIFFISPKIIGGGFYVFDERLRTNQNKK